MGAGWIGLETAAAAREYGCEVTVIDAAEAELPLLRRARYARWARVFAGLHRAHGVDLRLGQVHRDLGTGGGGAVCV